MKFKNLLLIFGIMLTGFFVSCSDDDDESSVVAPEGSNFTSLESPYLVCANRNPGGVGFDFVYNGEKGGANNMDSLSVDDFDYDVIVKTIKAEKTDGSLCGMPYFQLEDGAQAVNYSALYSDVCGYTAFQSLTAGNMESVTYASDEEGFDLSSLEAGSTGKPMQSDVQNELKKLVIGQTWKSTANNEIDEDELIWIIKTQEGNLVKFIVKDFPASPAPTETGYIDVEWELLD